MAKFYPLVRISVIISELRKRQYLDADGLIDAIARKAVLDGEYFPVSKRTLQRDFKDIYRLFGIEIKCNSSGQYFIAGYDRSIDDYEDLLLNFELLSSIDSDSTLQKIEKLCFGPDIQRIACHGTEIQEALRHRHSIHV